MNSLGLHSAPILHTDVKNGDRNNSQCTCTTCCTGFIPAGATSGLLFEREPRPSTTDRSFGSTEDPIDMHQPPPHLVNYWFDKLGLSLDLISSENSSNATGSSFQFPPFDGIDYSASGTANIETSSLENALVYNIESQENSASLPSPVNLVEYRHAQPRGVARHQTRIVCERQRAIRKFHGRPGKKPAAEYEPDPIKLEALCRLRGGMEIACQWIPRAFNGGVTLEALLRRLKLNEIESMNFQGGFALCLAYDGFLQTAEGGFECCLCEVGKRVWWKNKKDSVRHLRKFHFGLANQCITCHKDIYSTGEMNSHRCAPPQT